MNFRNTRKLFTDDSWALKAEALHLGLQETAMPPKNPTMKYINEARAYPRPRSRVFILAFLLYLMIWTIALWIAKARAKIPQIVITSPETKGKAVPPLSELNLL